MKRIIIGAGLVLLAAGCTQNAPVSTTMGQQPKGASMVLSSTAFQHNGLIPERYTCEGENINPGLEFGEVPADAKSLVLVVDDPDVPKDLKPDGVFDHWVVFNMPPETGGIPENTPPTGVQGNNGAGKAQYTGPCPPDREHRYFFRLYALDTMLDLPAGSTKQQVLDAMQGHIQAQAELMGTYNKKANR